MSALRLIPRVLAPWRRAPEPPANATASRACAWCKPLDRYSDINTLPSQCRRDKACDAPWCQRRAVTR